MEKRKNKKNFLKPEMRNSSGFPAPHLNPPGNKFDKLFLLDLKKTIALLVFWFIIVILHNFIFTFFGIEEKIFFTLAIILIPIYFIICLLYSVIERR